MSARLYAALILLLDLDLHTLGNGTMTSKSMCSPLLMSSKHTVLNLPFSQFSISLSASFSTAFYSRYRCAHLFSGQAGIRAHRTQPAIKSVHDQLFNKLFNRLLRQVSLRSPLLRSGRHTRSPYSTCHQVSSRPAFQQAFQPTLAAGIDALTPLKSGRHMR